MAEHELPLDDYHRAGLEITNGNPEVYKSLYSRRDDVTLANPFGPPVRGWRDVSATLNRAAENYRDGEVVGFENVSTIVTADLAYTVEIERYRARVGGAEELTPVSVRATSVGPRTEPGSCCTGTPTRSPCRARPGPSSSPSARVSGWVVIVSVVSVRSCDAIRVGVARCLARCQVLHCDIRRGKTRRTSYATVCSRSTGIVGMQDLTLGRTRMCECKT